MTGIKGLNSVDITSVQNCVATTYILLLINDGKYCSSLYSNTRPTSIKQPLLVSPENGFAVKGRIIIIMNRNFTLLISFRKP